MPPSRYPLIAVAVDAVDFLIVNDLPGEPLLAEVAAGGDVVVVHVQQTQVADDPPRGEVIVLRDITLDASGADSRCADSIHIHGDGFSIEYDADDVYFWTSGTMGDHTDNGGYSGGKANGPDVRLICRHKFKPGVTEYAEESLEQFYLNDNGARFADVDTEHDVIALWTYENSSDYIYVYRLSEIRKAKTITVKVTRESHNQGKSVTAYNLKTVTPIASFPWKRKGVTTGETNAGAVQGLCVYDDRIVMDFSGNILQKLVKVGVSADKQQLVKLNLSSDGTFEPEGVHIRKGQMYLGFVGDYPTSGSKKHTCIIKLK